MHRGWEFYPSTPLVSRDNTSSPEDEIRSLRTYGPTTPVAAEAGSRQGFIEFAAIWHPEDLAIIRLGRTPAGPGAPTGTPGMVNGRATIGSVRATSASSLLTKASP